MIQASMTIFGIIGGPILGIFTLGMFTTTSNQRVGFLILLFMNWFVIKKKGALCGLCIGLLFAGFLGFGRPKDLLTPTLDFSIADCSAFGGDVNEFNSTYNAIPITAPQIE